MKHRCAVLLGLLLATAWLALPGSASASNGGQGACVAHHPNYIEGVFEPHYTAGCSGHDEPELNPLSNLPGSGKNATWTFVLPSNGSHYGVDAYADRTFLPSGGDFQGIRVYRSDVVF